MGAMIKGDTSAALISDSQAHTKVLAHTTKVEKRGKPNIAILPSVPYLQSPI